MNPVVCEFVIIFPPFFCKFCEDLMFKCFFVYKVKNMYILVNQIVQEKSIFLANK